MHSSYTILVGACLLIHCAESLSPARRPSPKVSIVPTNQEGSDILTQVSEVNPDGSFYTKYETADGTKFEEQGQPKAVGNEQAEQVQGSSSWISKEGVPISITWQADENGAVFQGDHLPTPPPTPEIPPLIQRALEWIAANPSKEYQEESGQTPSLGRGKRAIRPSSF